MNATHVAPTLELERELAGSGFDCIVGFDEVGRGALAGPVMVGAAAMWASDVMHADVPEGLADSKLLTPRRRERMVEPLRSWCAASAVGQASNDEIDDWGISTALGVAALRALCDVEQQLGVAPTHAEPAGNIRVGAILDGPNDYISAAAGTLMAPVVPVAAAVRTQIKADQSCALVSAASVVAKVTRDHLMEQLAASSRAYEPYGWESNKGYGSKAHREAIARLGPSDLHRVSWHLV